MPETHKTLSEALLAVQQKLPHVGKDNEADTGKYKYRYADLGAVQDALLPLLNENGLVWNTFPTMHDGVFTLAYRITHPASSESQSGNYYLPMGAPQDIGSALTYARRYALCAVTGLAPGGDDDDGKAAQTAASKPAETVSPDVDVLAQEWIEVMEGATSLSQLQSAWEGAGKAGVQGIPKVIKVKDERKAALA